MSYAVIPAICERCGDIFDHHLCQPCVATELQQTRTQLIKANQECDRLRSLVAQQISVAASHSARRDDGSRRVDWAPAVLDASPLIGGQ